MIANNNQFAENKYYEEKETNIFRSTQLYFLFWWHINFENLLTAKNINLNKITFEIFNGNMSMWANIDSM